MFFFFFFQAEDGIRDVAVTGVQTCALPIWLDQAKRLASSTLGNDFLENTFLQDGSRLGDNISVVKAFSQLADKLSEDEVVKGDTSSYMTAKDLEKEIASLQEEGSPFWDKNHPNHEKSVQEVFKLRELLHNG